MLAIQVEGQGIPPGVGPLGFFRENRNPTYSERIAHKILIFTTLTV